MGTFTSPKDTAPFQIARIDVVLSSPAFVFPSVRVRLRWRRCSDRVNRPDLVRQDGGMRPMLASPATAVPSGPDWIHEVRWDGMRVLVDVHDGGVNLTSWCGNCAT